MLQSFIRGGNLRRWLGRPDCPPAIKECKALFDKAYGKQDDECTDNQPLPGVSQILPDDLRIATKQQKGVLYAHVKHDDVVYARASTHLGNSLVLFYPAGKTSSSPIPGCIQYIVSWEGNKTFVVRRHESAASGTSDPFAPYPHFPAKIYSSQLAERLEIVRVEWVLGHCARWAISPEHVVILNLGRD
jgi:hypothetical protein